MKYSSNKKILKKLANELSNAINNNTSEKSIVKTKKELESIKLKMNKWYDAYENNIISADDLMTRLKDLKERRAFLENYILECEKNANQTSSQSLNVEKLINQLDNFEKVWYKSNEEERRKIMLTIIKSIRVSKDNVIDIEFTY